MYCFLSPRASANFSRGEDGIGAWTVIIRDTQENQYNGTLVDWSITLWGVAIDADKAVLHPLPGEEHKTPSHHPTSTAALVTTTDLPSTHHVQATGNPSGHLDRPVNSKPTAEGSDPFEPESTDTDGLSHISTAVV
jgi:kexin